MKKLSTLLISTIVILFLPAIAFGQGTLSGAVVDSVTNDALVGANVQLRGTGLGAASDLEGNYRITNVPAGAYTVRISYIGYKAKEMKVNVTNKEITLNAHLIPDVVQGAEFVVTAQMRGQVAAINQQLTSNTIVNVVSEEKIRELPDANAAEAIGRLSGVSILRSGGEASRVLLRGLSDKYSVVTIDGVRMAPTDDNDRGMDLSTISQGSLAGIELFKALTSDKDGDAIAGSVNLVTKKAPSERLVRIEPRGGYNGLDKSAKQYNVTGRYGERFLDDRLGIQVFGNVERTIRSSETLDYNYDFTNLAGGADYQISNFQITYANEMRKRGGGSLLLDFDTPDGGSIRMDGVYNETSRDYLTSYRTYPWIGDVHYDYRDRETRITTFNSSLRGDNYFFGMEADWNVSFSQAKRVDPFDYEMDFVESSSTNPPAGMNNLPTDLLKGPIDKWPAYAINNFHEAFINWVYDRGQTNYDKERGGALDLKRSYRVTDLISGDFKFGGKYRAKARYAVFSDMRSPSYLYPFSPYTRLANGSIGLKDVSGTRFANLLVNGSNRPSFANFLDLNPPDRAIYGEYALNPLINRDALKLWRQLNINGYVDAGGSKAEYDPDKRVDGNYYDITERTLAGYVMNTLNIGREITVIAGIRIERDNNDYNSKITTQTLSGFPVPLGAFKDTSATHEEEVVLPNLQIILRPVEFMNLRLAAYKALARPDFNQRLVKFVSTETSGANSLNIGNPNLRNAVAWNYEVQTQFFGNEIGLFSVSAFYKRIKDMQHFVDAILITGQANLDKLGIPWKHPYPTDASQYRLTYPYNESIATFSQFEYTYPVLAEARKARIAAGDYSTRVWGLEVEHQTDLKFLPGFLKNIVLNYNFTLVRSETWIATSTVVPDSVYNAILRVWLPQGRIALYEKKQKLQDQPEFFGNVSLGYDIGGFSFRVSLFHQGSYNTTFSGDQRTDGAQDGYTRLDFSAKQKLTDHISVLLDLHNITNTQEGTSIINRDERISRPVVPNASHRYGMAVDFGVRVEL